MITMKHYKILIVMLCASILLSGNYSSVSFAEPGIKIVEPLEGDVLITGEEMTITVEPVEGFDLEWVDVGPPGATKKIDMAPFSMNFTVPNDKIGSINIMALGGNSVPQMTMDEITVVIQTNATLQSLNAGAMKKFRVTNSGVEESLIDFHISEEIGPHHLIVEGVYSDGIKRKLRSSSTGTTYTSHDEGIVTVDENGLVTIQGVGETTITVSNSGVSTDVSVNIEKKWVSLADKETILPVTEINIAPLSNIAGWHNSDLEITLKATDNEGGSGVKEIRYTCVGAVNRELIVVGDTASIYISTEGMTTLTYYATDNVGNVESQKTHELKLDKTPPAALMPDLDSTYIYNSTLSLNFSASDSLSGLKSLLATFNDVPIVNGDTVTLTNPGVNTFKLEAADHADNSASQSAVINIEYIFSGFLPPVVMDGSRVYKLGRTLPIKFQLQDVNQTYVSTAIATLTLQQFSEESPVGEIIEVESTSGADDGNTFRYASDNEQYIFNLNTKSLSPGTWQLQVRLDDGTTKTGIINLK